MQNATTNNKAMTARILTSRARYFDGHAIRVVPMHVIVVFCEVCNHVEQFPSRHGINFAEFVRERHLTKEHGALIKMGTVIV